MMSPEIGSTLQPEDIPSAFDSALNRGDIDAVMMLFHPRAIMRMTDGTVAEGSVALRNALGNLIAVRPKLRNSIRRVIRTDEIALVLLDWEIRIAPPGQEEIVESGIATQVVERHEDGIWRLRISNPLGIS